MTKKERFNLFMSNKTRSHLNKLSTKHKRNKSNMIVFLIDEAYEKEFGADNDD